MKKSWFLEIIFQNNLPHPAPPPPITNTLLPPFNNTCYNYQNIMDISEDIDFESIVSTIIIGANVLDNRADQTIEPITSPPKSDSARD